MCLQGVDVDDHVYAMPRLPVRRKDQKCTSRRVTHGQVRRALRQVRARARQVTAKDRSTIPDLIPFKIYVPRCTKDLYEKRLYDLYEERAHPDPVP